MIELALNIAAFLFLAWVAWIVLWIVIAIIIAIAEEA